MGTTVASSDIRSQGKARLLAPIALALSLLLPTAAHGQDFCPPEASLETAQCWIGWLRDDVAQVTRPGLRKNLGMKVDRIEAKLVDADSALAQGKTVRGKNLRRAALNNAKQLLRQLLGKGVERQMDPGLRDFFVFDTESLIATLEGLFAEVEQCGKCNDRNRSTFDVCVKGECRSIPDTCPCFTGAQLGAAGIVTCFPTEPGLVAPNAAFFDAAEPVQCSANDGTVAVAVAQVRAETSSCMCMTDSGDIPFVSLTEEQKESCRALVAASCGAPAPEPVVPLPTPTPVTCVPKTCGDVGAQCGTVPDGCGGLITCGGCDDGSPATYDVCVQGSCQSIVDDCPCWTGAQLEAAEVGVCFFPPHVTGPTTGTTTEPGGLSCSQDPVQLIATTNQCACLDVDDDIHVLTPTSEQLLHCADLVTARCGIRDLCPDDPFKVEPLACGCNQPDTDANGNGVADCREVPPPPPPPQAPPLIVVDATFTTLDTDGDGATDDVDECPTNPHKTAASACGCSIDVDDVNGDGMPDCIKLNVIEVLTADLQVDNNVEFVDPSASIVRHTIDVKNNGPHTVAAVVDLELSPVLEIVTRLVENGQPGEVEEARSCSRGTLLPTVFVVPPTGPAKILVTCELGTMEAGATATLTVDVIVPQDGFFLAANALPVVYRRVPEGGVCDGPNGECDTFELKGSAIARVRSITPGNVGDPLGNNMSPTIIWPPTEPQRLVVAMAEECEDDIVSGSMFEVLLDVDDCEHDLTDIARIAVSIASSAVALGGVLVGTGTVALTSGNFFYRGGTFFLPLLPGG
ncbi:MAG TPA: hypothetical protein VIS07_08295 [Candidatus Binatia bacterium]